VSTQVKAAVDIIRHDNHVPPASLTQRTFTAHSCTNTILISNVSSATTVLVSFDGVNTFTLKPGGSFSMNFSSQLSYWISGDGVGAVEVLLGSER
jgi:hypothetical protein